MFYLQRSHGPSYSNGRPHAPEAVFFLPPRSEFCIAHEATHEWATIFVAGELAESAGLVPEQLRTADAGAQLLAVRPAATRTLWSLIQLITRSSDTEPSILTEALSIHGLRESVLSGISQLLHTDPASPIPRGGRPAVANRALLKSIVEQLEDAPEENTTVRELVTASGVSEKTLRDAFQRFFGISPQRYLQLSRLHRARKQLLAPANESVTVTQVAANVGMWDFGRFAGRYRRLFGELPSETLQRNKSIT